VKLRRFTDAGVAAVRETLPKIEETGDLSLAAALVADENRTELITELTDLDLDPPTTHAFCEYFHSLMKDRKLRMRLRDDLRAYYKTHPAAKEPMPRALRDPNLRWEVMG